MIFRINTLFLVLFFSTVRPKSAMGRPPEKIDYTACQVQLYERLDKIQEGDDPNAIVYAYFNRTGFVCKTYCKFKSVNKNVAKISMIIDSPYYVLCAKDRYCSKGGKCKKIGTPLKLDEFQTTNQESSNVTTVAPTLISTIHSVGSPSTATPGAGSPETASAATKSTPIPAPKSKVTAEPKGEEEEKSENQE